MQPYSHSTSSPFQSSQPSTSQIHKGEQSSSDEKQNLIGDTSVSPQIQESLSLQEHIAAKQGIDHRPASVESPSLKHLFESLNLTSKQQLYLFEVYDQTSKRDYLFRGLLIDICNKLALAKEKFDQPRLQKALSNSGKTIGNHFFSSTWIFFLEAELLLNPEISENTTIDSVAPLLTSLENLIRDLDNFYKNSKEIVSQTQHSATYAKEMREHLDRAKEVLNLCLKLAKITRGLNTLKEKISTLFNINPSSETELKISSVFHPRVKVYLTFFYDNILYPYIKKTGLLCLYNQTIQSLINSSQQLNKFIEPYFKLIASTSKASQDDKTRCISSCFELIQDKYGVPFKEVSKSKQVSIKETEGQNLRKAALVYVNIIQKSLVFEARGVEFANINLNSLQILQTIALASSEFGSPYAAFESSMMTHLNDTVQDSKDLLNRLGLTPLTEELKAEIDNDEQLDSAFNFILTIGKEDQLESKIIENRALLTRLKTHQEQQFLKWQQLGEKIRDFIAGSPEVLHLPSKEKTQLLECLQLIETTLQQWALNLFIFAYFTKKIFDPPEKIEIFKGLQQGLEASKLLLINFIPEETWDLILKSPPGKESSPFTSSVADETELLKPFESTHKSEETVPLQEGPQLEEVQQESLEIETEVRIDYKSKGKQRVVDEKTLESNHPPIPENSDLNDLIKMLKKRGLKWEKLIRILGSLGGRIDRTTGSHHMFKFGEGESTVPVPKKPQQKRGTQLEIADQVADALRPPQPKTTEVPKESSQTKKGKQKSAKKSADGQDFS